MAVDPQMKALARRVKSLERKLLATKQPGLSFSTIEDGALTAVDVDGKAQMIIGKQFDGTQTAAVVTGPPPPEPTMPMVTPQISTLRVFWDGTFADGSPAPMDFERVLVYAVPFAQFTTANPLAYDYIVGQLNSALGGEVSAVLEPDVEYAVYLVAWSQAGKYSTPSSVAVATTGAEPQGIDSPNPPSESPTITTTGSADAITVVAHGTTAPDTVLDYYMDGTIRESTRSSVMVFRTDNAGNALDPDATYSFHVVARNGAGSAAASPTVTGILNNLVDSTLVQAIVAAGFVLAGEIEVGNIRINADEGIVIPLSSGGEIRLPADGSPAIIDAILRTNDLSVAGGLTINGITNYLNGKLILASGTSDPQSGMAISSVSAKLYLRPSNLGGTTCRGLARSPGSTPLWGTIVILPDNKNQFVIFNDAGNAVATVHSDDNVLNMASVTANTTHFFVLGERWNATAGVSQWRIHKYDRAGNQVDAAWIEDSAGNRITNLNEYKDGAIAVDAITGNLWVGRTLTDGRVRFYEYDESSIVAATISTPITTESGFSMVGLVGGMYVGNADWGTKTFVVCNSTASEFGNFAFTPTGARDSAKDWSSRRPAGLHWDGSRFINSDADADGITLNEYNTNTVATTVYGQYTWYDNNAAGGNKESAPSPLTSFSIPKRAWPLLNVPAPPNSGTGDDAANAVRIYLDTDTATRWLTTITTGQPTSYIASRLTGTGAAPPTSSTFTASSATGELTSANAVAYLRGTGAFKMGGITGDGTDFASADGAKITGFVPIGAVVPYIGSTVPAGWLLCDGSTFSSTTYPALFNVVGSTTLPDLRDRFISGAGTTRALKSSGGADSVTMPAHTHSISGHSGNATGLTAATGTAQTNLARNTELQGHAHGGATGAIVTPPSISTVPKFYALNYIIRAV